MLPILAVSLAIAVTAGWRRDSWKNTARRFVFKVPLVATMAATFTFFLLDEAGMEASKSAAIALAAHVIDGVEVALLIMITYAAAIVCAMTLRRRSIGI